MRNVLLPHANLVLCLETMNTIKGIDLVVSNGEFGQRLVDHAKRFQLDFETVEAPWGESFAEDDIRRALARGEPKAWLWAVHAETSTGVLNDLDKLKRRIRRKVKPAILLEREGR